jgi:hypothetical protein
MFSLTLNSRAPRATTSALARCTSSYVASASQLRTRSRSRRRASYCSPLLRLDAATWARVATSHFWRLIVAIFKTKASASKTKAYKTKSKPGASRTEKATSAYEQSYTQYMLVLPDQLSRRVILHSCTALDSANAFDGITACIKEHGLPMALYSDTASHFVSGLIL